VEPFFTFEAGIPPAALGDLTLTQIRAHLDYHAARKGGRDGK